MVAQDVITAAFLDELDKLGQAPSPSTFLSTPGAAGAMNLAMPFGATKGQMPASQRLIPGQTMRMRVPQNTPVGMGMGVVQGEQQ